MAVSPATYRQALAAIKHQVAAARSSFTAGMAILPPERRAAMYGLYAFCRAVDDIADDGATDASRQQGLSEWRERIANLFRGLPGDDITVVLSPAVKAFALVEADFQAIIDGMAMDAGAPICAPDLATLDRYCDRVASAVGRVSVRLFGDGSATAMQVAHHLGRAFQLTNILRDIGEDAARGRLYLPSELLAKHGVLSRQPPEVLRDPALPAVCRELAATAQAHFDAADTAMAQCDPTAMRPARVMRAYYGAIFEVLTLRDWRDPAHRVSLPKWRKAVFMLQHMLGRL